MLIRLLVACSAEPQPDPVVRAPNIHAPLDIQVVGLPKGYTKYGGQFDMCTSRPGGRPDPTPRGHLVVAVDFAVDGARGRPTAAVVEDELPGWESFNECVTSKVVFFWHGSPDSEGFQFEVHVGGPFESASNETSRR